MNHRARPPQIVRYVDWRGRSTRWRHPKRSLASTVEIANDGDMLTATDLIICDTAADRLVPGARCGCGEWYAPTIQPALHELVLYDVAEGAHPRFVPLRVDVQRPDDRHATTVRLFVLDRKTASVLRPLQIDVSPSVATWAIGSGRLTATFLDFLARETAFSPGQLASHFDASALQQMIEDRLGGAFPRSMGGATAHVVLSHGRVWFTSDDVYREVASAPRSGPGLPKTDTGITGAAALPTTLADLAAELTPDVKPPTKKDWKALNARIDAAAPARKATIDMIQRCAGNSDGA